MRVTFNGLTFEVSDAGQNTWVAKRNGIEGYGSTQEEACQVCEREIQESENRTDDF